MHRSCPMMNQVSFMSRFVGVGLFSFLLLSCSGDSDDYSKWIHKAQVRKSPKMEPIPKFELLPFFKLTKQDLGLNPFKSERAVEDEFDLGKTGKVLNAFPLSTLKFVGTLEEGRKKWALIKQPDGQIRQVSKGDFMGREQGLVVLIQSDAIQIKQWGSLKKHLVRLTGSEM